MSNKLYVGGLPYSVTDGRLQEVFSAHGTVESARVISAKFTGQSRGFGFVEMSSGTEARTAIGALNGANWMDVRWWLTKRSRWRAVITAMVTEDAVTELAEAIAGSLTFRM